MPTHMDRFIARTNLLRDRFYNGTLTDGMAKEYARLIVSNVTRVREAFERVHGRRPTK